MDWSPIVNLGFRSVGPVTNCLSHSVAPTVEASGLHGSARPHSVAPSVEAGGLHGSARPHNSHQKTEILLVPFTA